MELKPTLEERVDKLEEDLQIMMSVLEVLMAALEHSLDKVQMEKEEA